MGGNVSRKFIGSFIIFDPLSNSAFPFFRYADHLSFFAISYAQIQRNVLLPLSDTLTTRISADPCHSNQRAAQQSFAACQLGQL